MPTTKQILYIIDTDPALAVLSSLLIGSILGALIGFSL